MWPQGKFKLYLCLTLSFYQTVLHEPHPSRLWGPRGNDLTFFISRAPELSTKSDSRQDSQKSLLNYPEFPEFDSKGYALLSRMCSKKKRSWTVRHYFEWNCRSSKCLTFSKSQFVYLKTRANWGLGEALVYSPRPTSVANRWGRIRTLVSTFNLVVPDTETCL